MTENKAIKTEFSQFKELPQEQLNSLFNEFLQFLKQKQFSFEEPKLGIPISIFSDELSALESIVKYFRENCQMTYTEIASILKRQPGPIGVICRKAKSKQPSNLDVSSQQKIPRTIFTAKNTIFESVVMYLKEHGLSFKQISSILHRNYRTTWTTYQRAKKKGEADE